jgi:hypothetical protein
MRGVRTALITLAIVGAAAGCGGSPSGPSASPAAPSATLATTPTPAPTPTPKPEYQPLEDLAVGACFDPVEDRDDQALIAGIVRRCDEVHLMEVIGLPRLDYPDTAPIPAKAELDRQSDELCRAEFKAYVGIDFDDSRLDATYYPPSEATWSVGDRLVVCTVVAAEIAPFTRSVRGSGM